MHLPLLLLSLIPPSLAVPLPRDHCSTLSQRHGDINPSQDLLALGLLDNQKAISKMCPSHNTPQPKGLTILSSRIWSKCPSTAVTVYRDLWGHSCRPTSQPSLQITMPLPAHLFQILPSVGKLLSSSHRQGKARRSHICSLRSHTPAKSKHGSIALPPGSLKTDSILPSKDHREPSTEAMASEAREGTANWAEQCVTCNAQLKQMPRSLL